MLLSVFANAKRRKYQDVDARIYELVDNLMVMVLKKITEFSVGIGYSVEMDPK